MNKDSGGLRKKPRGSGESSRMFHRNIFSEEQPGIVSGDSETISPTCDGASGAVLPACDSPGQSVHVRDVLELIASVIGCFNESNKSMLSSKLARMELVYDSDKDLHEMLVSFESIFKSPYAHFVSSMIYSIVFRIMCCKIKSCSQVKTLGFALLLEHYDPLRVFHDMVDAYSVLDTFKIGQKSFRNHALYRSLSRVYEKALLSESTDHSVILDCADVIRTCVPFAEFLSRNAEDLLCRDIMTVYSYNFLSKLPVDLESVRKANDLKDVDDPVISRIFAVLHTIRLSYRRQSECTSQLKGSPRGCDTGTERSSLVDADHGNVMLSAIVSRSEEMLKTLFGSRSMSSIILTVYKRLFNYFLFKNRRMLAGIKVPKIFTKKEKSFIFRHLRSSTQSFANVFKQLDQGYILKLLSKSCAHDAYYSLLLESIREDYLGKDELLRFYSFYIDFLEFARRPVKMKMKNIEAFSTVFNSRVDKSFSRFVVFHHPVSELSSRNVIEMLAHYTTICNHARSDYTDSMGVDVVELVSLVVDNPQKLLVKASIRYYNDVLRILANMSFRFSIGLVCRIVPVLRQLIFCNDYVQSSGRLYRKLHGQFGFRDDVLITGTSSTHRHALMAKGAIGHSTFEACFASTAEMWRACTEGQTISLSESVVDNALVFYLHYKPSFALEHGDILKRILQKKNRSTLYLLEYLREYTTKSTLALGTNVAADLADECEEPFTFIASNIRCLYDLYNSDAMLGSRSSLRHLLNYNPFIGAILGIFLDSLKTRAILPHMVIPYLMPKADCSYLYRNYIDSCVNCINDALYLVASRIRGLIVRCKDCDASSDVHDQDADLADVHNDIAENALGELFAKELSVMFLYSIYKHSSLERILGKIDHQDDMLLAFIILRNLRPFPSKERETLIRHIEKNTSDERIFDLLGKSREFYRKSPKSVLPAHFIA